jgi:polyisoprenoid-binding protein YceI
VGDHRYKVVGDLTIRDQTHPVELDAETTEIIRDPFGNRRFGLSLQGTISRRQWGLTWNMVLEAGSLMVSDEVRIHVEAEVFTPVEAAAQASG